MTEQEQVFEFLDELRESGETNMYGAVPYIVEAFNITKYDAQRHLVKWMETFGERHNPSGAHQECEADAERRHHRIFTRLALGGLRLRGGGVVDARHGRVLA